MSNNFGKIAASVTRHARRMVIKCAHDLQALAVAEIQTGAKSGKTYKVPGLRGGQTHTASAPGEAPAALFGVLAGSISVEPDPDPTALEARVGVTAEYGAALELGREDGSIEARPYLRPAADRIERSFAQQVGKAVQAGVREAAAGA